ASFYFGDAPEPDLSAIALRDITYRVAIPVAWADDMREAAWDAVAERPWIVAPEPSSHRRLVMKLFGDRAPPRVIEVDSELVIVNLVESGAGISLIRDDIGTPNDAGRYFLWPGAEVTTQLWLVHAADREAEPMVAALREVLRE